MNMHELACIIYSYLSKNLFILVKRKLGRHVEVNARDIHHMHKIDGLSRAIRHVSSGFRSQSEIPFTYG